MLSREDGASILFQTDYDWPAVASNFGWRPEKYQPNQSRLSDCPHINSDGTVDCRSCNATAGGFISDAREFLDDHDGEKCENPGYALTYAAGESPDDKHQLAQLKTQEAILIQNVEEAKVSLEQAELFVDECEKRLEDFRKQNKL